MHIFAALRHPFIQTGMHLKTPLQNILCLHLCVRDHIKYVHWGSDVCAKLCHLCWRISVDQALGLSCL